MRRIVEKSISCKKINNIIAGINWHFLKAYHGLGLCWSFKCLPNFRVPGRLSQLKRQSLDFSSCHDFRVVRSSSASGSARGRESAGDSVSLCPSPSAFSLSNKLISFLKILKKCLPNFNLANKPWRQSHGLIPLPTWIKSPLRRFFVNELSLEKVVLLGPSF